LLTGNAANLTAATFADYGLPLTINIADGTNSIIFVDSRKTLDFNNSENAIVING
jgi:hypothetical protein